MWPLLFCCVCFFSLTHWVKFHQKRMSPEKDRSAQRTAWPFLLSLEKCILGMPVNAVYNHHSNFCFELVWMWRKKVIFTNSDTGICFTQSVSQCQKSLLKIKKSGMLHLIQLLTYQNVFSLSLFNWVYSTRFLDIKLYLQTFQASNVLTCATNFQCFLIFIL